MEFNAKVSGSGSGILGKIGGRFTGSYLRDVSWEAQRIIERDPERSTDEITAEVMQMMDANGMRHADPSQVRRLVAKIKDEL